MTATVESTQVGQEIRLARRIYFYDILAILFLAVLPLLFWWRLITPNPADASILKPGDLTDQFLPQRLAIAAQLQAGRFPFWNPWINAGQPFLGDTQAAILYPINLFLLLLGRSSFRDFEYEIIGHYAIAGIGVYLLAASLLSRYHAGRWGALVAAITFTYGGYLTSYPALQPAVLRSAVWLPWVLFGLVRCAAIPCYSDKRLRSFLPALPAYALSGAALAMAVLGGHPQTIFYIFLIAGIFTLYLAWNRAASSRRLAWQPLLGGIVCLFFGLSLPAAFLLPAVEFAQESVRSKTSYEFTTSYGLPLKELFALLVPSVGGGGSLYSGIVPLLLAMLALMLAWSTRRIQMRHNTLLLWLVLGVVGLLVAFSGATFVGSVAYLFLPGFALFRGHERLVILVSLSIAMLAGEGAAMLGSGLNRRSSRRLRGIARMLLVILTGAALLLGVMFIAALAPKPEGSQIDVLLIHWYFLLPPLVLGIGLIVARSRGIRPRLVWWVALLGLVIFDLFSLNFQSDIQDGYIDFGLPYLHSPAAEYLQAQRDSGQLFRISSESLLPADGSAGMVYRLQDITGSDPLALDRWETFNKIVEGGRKLELLDVGYIVTKRDLNDPRYERVFNDGDINIYRVIESPGRAWFVNKIEVLADEQATLQRLSEREFDPRTTAILPHSLAEGNPASSGTGSISAIIQSSGELSLQYRTTAPSLLVISEIYDTGWRAAIDGIPTRVMRADYTLMAVQVPAGSHTLSLSYEPQSWKLGLAISLVAIALLILVVVGGLFFRVKPRSLRRAAIHE